MNKHTLLHRVLPIAGALALGGGVGAGVYAGLGGGSSNTTTTTTVAATSTVQPAARTQTVSSLTQLYKDATPGVVDITVTSTAQNPGFGFGQQQTQAEGTGFVYDTKGDILTAAHVVDGASSIKVHFQDGSTANATLVGKDDSTDTAVIKVNVDSSKLHPLALGSSASVQPGQEVVAIGSPFGLTETMTAGIVSAINRTITAPNNFSISGAIQTDAPINHGNSGGPLLTTDGKVIGINVQIDSNSNGSEGVGFATPIDTVKSVASTLVAGGKVQHAYLGIQVADAPNGGAKVGTVLSGGPAAKGGMQAGDVITKINGTQIQNADGLTAAINNYKPGDKITVSVARNGSSKTLTITLGTRPNSSS